MAVKYDLLIRSGRIVDGTGNPYYRADVGIANGRITNINGNIDPAGAKRVILANGLTVSPGFFDAHSHDDAYLIFNPACDEKVLQGVTTEVIGNCGLSIAPQSERYGKEMRRIFRGVSAQRLSDEELKFQTFGEYLRKLEGMKPGINIISLVGHGTIRAAVMGFANRVPTDDELKIMKEFVASAMEEGAFGLSTGLILVPGSFARTEEIIGLSKVVSEYNGVYTSHIRSESDRIISAINEALRIGEEAKIPVQISHHKVAGKDNWGKSAQTLKLMAEARARGVEVICDQYPYTAGTTFLTAALPPHALAGGPEAYSEKLKDPKYRTELIAAIESGGAEGWENLVKNCGFEGIIISLSNKHKDYIGKSIAEIAKQENKNPYEVLFDLVVEEKTDIIPLYFMMAEDDIQRIMRSPLTMIGTDGIPGFGVGRVHPRLTGTFPRVLGRYVREQGVLSLEEAIRKMTALPAQAFRVKSKGLLKEGFDADIVVFDPATIIDKSTFENPNQSPEGIKYVLINGEIAAENGKITGAASGRVLRHNK
jgi:N-acyl-D-amino-acid deacylase